MSRFTHLPDVFLNPSSWKIMEVNDVESEDFPPLEVVSVRERTETKFGKGEKIVEIDVHSIVIVGRDGLRITFQRYETPFPWKIGDPITLSVKSTQTHLGVE